MAWLTLVVVAWIANLQPRELPSDPYIRTRLLSQSGFHREIFYGNKMPTSGPIEPKQLYAWIDREAEGGRLSLELRSRLNSLSRHPETADLSKIARSYALCQVEGQPLKAFRELRLVSDDLPMVLCTRALSLAHLGRKQEALEIWLGALEGGLGPEEWRHCANFAGQNRHFDLLKKLVEVASPDDSAQILQRWITVYSGSFWKSPFFYLKALRQLHPWTWIGALLTGFIWLWILRGCSWRMRLGFYLLGVLSFLFTLPTLRFVLWKLHLSELGRRDLGFAHQFLEVGLAEELTKLLPVLLWCCWKPPKAPRDLALIGVLSALAFASWENFSYFEDYPGAWLRRFLVSVSIHLSLTTALSYGLTYFSGRRTALGLLALALIALCHASFNYFDNSKALLALLGALWLGWLLRKSVRVDALQWLGGAAVLLLTISFWQVHSQLSTDLANALFLSNSHYLVVLPAFFGFFKARQDWGVESWVIFLSVACWALNPLLGDWLALRFWILYGTSLTVGYLILCLGSRIAWWREQPTPSPAHPELQKLGFRPVTVKAQGTFHQHQGSRRLFWLKWTLWITLAQTPWFSLLGDRVSASDLPFLWCQVAGVMLALNFCLIWPTTLSSPTVLGAWVHPGGISLLAFRSFLGPPLLLAFSHHPGGYLVTRNQPILNMVFLHSLLPETLFTQVVRTNSGAEVVAKHQEFLTALEEAGELPEQLEADPDLFLSLLKQKARNAGFNPFAG